MPTRDSLREYRMYQRATERHPESCRLAEQIFEHCRTKHGARLRWPSGKTEWIISEPNYFAFGVINTLKTAVMVDVSPVGRSKYISPNGTTEEKATQINLRDALRANGGIAHTRFNVVAEDQLPVAFQILDIAFQMSEERRQKRSKA